MIEGIPNLTADTFDAFIKENDGIILFHKKLCPHCKVIATVLEKCKVQQPALKTAAIDSEEETSLMEKFGVERVPTVCVFKGGEMKTKKTGIMNPKEMLAFYMGA